MVLLEKLKLSKPLVRAMTDAGYLGPKEIQLKTMSRILGAQDIIAIAPQGSGKTSTYVLGSLMRLKYGFEEAPRALVLVPDKEHVLAVIERYELLNKNKTIRIVGLYPEGGMESQMNALADGADIVVATPDRARAIYLKLGLNLNKIMMFIVDDAAEIVKRGMQLPVAELARSIVKCQHLIFTDVFHDKLNLLTSQFMNQATTFEIDDLGEQKLETIDQILYKVPDFKTKVNLLNLLLKDKDVFSKVLVFVNTRLTAEKVFKSLFKYLDKEIAIYKPLFFDHPGFDLIDDFKQSEDTRILLVADDLKESLDLNDIPFIFHLEMPLEMETFIGRIVKNTSIESGEALAISFATDLELSMVKKIEQAIGLPIPLAELPEDLVIEKDKPKKTVKTEVQETESGSAFHAKKQSNIKDYNYSSREKAKMKFKNR
ncbi:ATP-dependent RNA helicase RhlE [Daejeonella rubra]|uniref:ATP-dependent RNA helicase RhlE n=1 Tax=Daejeonella rubra TaxID=990371 RepID=A0A1G9SDT3_9SPHI|nr:DEAD/DEAH box helicase [Daejeonella rubra]SDM33633.1 ATP-dependent RNA helicase RhlE [Daejeonella rubra]